MENQESYERYGGQADIDHSMQKINSLLQIPPRYSGLKPILDMVIMAFAPGRIFMVTHQLNIANQNQSYTEIILVLDHIDGSGIILSTDDETFIVCCKRRCLRGKILRT